MRLPNDLWMKYMFVCLFLCLFVFVQVRDYPVFVNLCCRGLRVSCTDWCSSISPEGQGTVHLPRMAADVYQAAGSDVTLSVRWHPPTYRLVGGNGVRAYRSADGLPVESGQKYDSLAYWWPLLAAQRSQAFARALLTFSILTIQQLIALIFTQVDCWTISTS